MKKFVADRLEDAYDAACKEFGCSITELKYEIVQYPSKGVLGLFAKKAIIVADIKVKDIPPKEPTEPKIEEIKPSTPTTQEIETTQDTQNTKEASSKDLDTKSDIDSDTQEDEVLDSFFQDNKPKNIQNSIIQNTPQVAKEIEDKLKELISTLCFDIDRVEVDIKDNIAYIFIDGTDAALLIGKEGYRYNALSYLLFNWINLKYGLYIKLEIAEFLQTQAEMIRNYIQPVVEHVEKEGWGRTRPLDGILAQIALEQLREKFPNKYVALKKNKIDDKRYIVINDFIK